MTTFNLSNVNIANFVYYGKTRIKVTTEHEATYKQYILDSVSWTLSTVKKTCRHS